MGKKADSRVKILDAAGHLFRARGVAAVTIAEVMQACGMTHGGFYAHFGSKAELQAATLAHVASKQREIWFAGLSDLDAATQLSSLTSRYLNAAHRDHPEMGCPYAALAFTAAQDAGSDNSLQAAYGRELEVTVQRLIDSGAVADRDGALAFLVLIIGGMVLSRALGTTNQSDNVIRAARAASLRALAQQQKHAKMQET